MISGVDLKTVRTQVLKESQAAFAERLGVKQSAVSRWEKFGPPESGPAKLLLEKIVSEAREAAA